MPRTAPYPDLLASLPAGHIIHSSARTHVDCPLETTCIFFSFLFFLFFLLHLCASLTATATITKYLKSFIPFLRLKQNHKARMSCAGWWCQLLKDSADPGTQGPWPPVGLHLLQDKTSFRIMHLASGNFLDLSPSQWINKNVLLSLFCKQKKFLP